MPANHRKRVYCAECQCIHRMNGHEPAMSEETGFIRNNAAANEVARLQMKHALNAHLLQDAGWLAEQTGKLQERLDSPQTRDH